MSVKMTREQTVTKYMYLRIDGVLQSGLSQFGVDLMVGGVGELWTKGIVQSKCVAEVSQSSAVGLSDPLTHLKI